MIRLKKKSQKLKKISINLRTDEERERLRGLTKDLKELQKQRNAAGNIDDRLKDRGIFQREINQLRQ